MKLFAIQMTILFSWIAVIVLWLGRWLVGIAILGALFVLACQWLAAAPGHASTVAAWKLGGAVVGIYVAAFVIGWLSASWMDWLRGMEERAKPAAEARRVIREAAKRAKREGKRDADFFDPREPPQRYGELVVFKVNTHGKGR